MGMETRLLLWKEQTWVVHLTSLGMRKRGEVSDEEDVRREKRRGT